MLCNSIIATILWANGMVVQTRRFKITNAIGKLVPVIERIDQWDVDEFVILRIRGDDETAWLRDIDAARQICTRMMAVGGGIKTAQDGARLIEVGADTIVVRRTPGWEVAEFAERFGQQAVMQSIDIGVHRGHMLSCAGQYLVNSLEHDGGRDGYDLDAIRWYAQYGMGRRVVAMGGAFEPRHFADGLDAGADAVAAGNLFHYRERATEWIRAYLLRHHYQIRPHNSHVVTSLGYEHESAHHL